MSVSGPGPAAEVLGRRARLQEYLAEERFVDGDALREILTIDCARRS